VSVRDKITKEPVAGAEVQARTVHFFFPMSYINNSSVPLKGWDPILDSSPPRSARGVTGSDGAVRLEVIKDHPVQLFVIVSGYAPQTIDLLEFAPRKDMPSDWLDADPDPALPWTSARMEVQLIP
jgi:hypothetical protein